MCDRHAWLCGGNGVAQLAAHVSRACETTHIAALTQFSLLVFAFVFGRKPHLWLWLDMDLVVAAAAVAATAVIPYAATLRLSTATTLR
jgi:hypothetical protein